MNPINKFIVLTAVATLMIATFVVSASDQAYAVGDLNIIIGSDVGQQNSGDTIADGGASSGEADGPSIANGGTFGAEDLIVD